MKYENITLNSIHEAMDSTEQTKGQTITQHGESVWIYAKKILSGDFKGLKIPDWLNDNFFQIVNQIVDYETFKRYCLYHDCGKPFCKNVDEDGKIHFPNHAEVSGNIYGILFPYDMDGRWLVENDMALHTYRSDQIEELCKSTEKSKCFSLIISALAEIHSNADMFGGIDSTSFKIKWKKINRRGKQIVNFFLKEEGDKFYSYIILRKDMSDSHRLVQSSHAAMEHPFHFGENHPSIICVEVKDEKKLKKVASKLLDEGIQYKIFREGAGVHEGEITAICTNPLKHDSSERNFFSRYQLA